MATKSSSETPQSNPVKNEIKFKASDLINSKKFSKYQKDFVRAILENGEYTINEAKDKIEKYLNTKCSINKKVD